MVVVDVAHAAVNARRFAVALADFDDGLRMLLDRFAFGVNAVATHTGQVAWANHYAGDFVAIDSQHRVQSRYAERRFDLQNQQAVVVDLLEFLAFAEQPGTADAFASTWMEAHGIDGELYLAHSFSARDHDTVSAHVEAF